MYVLTAPLCTCVSVYVVIVNCLLLPHTAEFVTTHVTVWLAIDLATPTGRKLLKNGLEYMVCKISDIHTILISNRVIKIQYMCCGYTVIVQLFRELCIYYAS